MPKRINSLYIHIPFCEHICHYCDFTKLFYNQKFSEPYLKALFSELDSYNINKVDTIYIGGGTPTSLSNNELEALLKKVQPYLSKDGEFTVEANVESLNKEKLLLLKKHGVNRLSIGIQSTNNKTLEFIGRKHTYEDAIKAIKLARKYDFNNINVDLMFGFPEEFDQSLKEDLVKVIKLNTEHISIYSLIVSPGTKFSNDKVKLQEQDKLRNQYDLILTTLRKVGYKRYEVSNFAKDEKYSRHNLTYWNDNEYYGVGLGASGYINGVRYTNTKNLDNYLKHSYIDTKEKLTKKEQLEDFLLCSFRLEDGFSKQEFKKRFGKDFEVYFKGKYESFIKDKLLEINSQNIKLTDDGLIIMDFILLKLL